MSQRWSSRHAHWFILGMLLFLSYAADPAWTQQKKPAPRNAWADIWQRIMGRRAQEKPRTSRGIICAVIPQGMNQRVIWRDRPIFVWKSRAGRIVVLDDSNPRLSMWDVKPADKDTFIQYAGKPLQPGNQYLWRAETGGEMEQVMFEMLEQPKRDWVTNQLTQLEKQLQQQNATPEERVKRRVELFLNWNLLLDAMQELYTLDKPSAELKSLQQQLMSKSCPGSPNDRR